MQTAVGIDATIAEKGPVLSCLINLREIAIDHENLFLLGRCFGDYAPERISDERLSPEVELAFAANAIDDHHKDSIRNSVSALDRFPCGMLGQVDFRFLIRQPTDRGRIKKKLCTTERSESRCFRKPLV